MINITPKKLTNSMEEKQLIQLEQNKTILSLNFRTKLLDYYDYKRSRWSVIIFLGFPYEMIEKLYGTPFQ
jgi:hypothetical protein